MKKLLFLLTPFFAYAIALTSAISVSAASEYDDNANTVNNIEIKSSGYYGINCDPTDISIDWSSYITDVSKFKDPDDVQSNNARTSFLNALNNGRWGVSISNQWGGGGYSSMVTVYWTEDANLSAIWDETPDQVNSSVANRLIIANQDVMYGNGICTPAISNINLDTNSQSIISNKEGYHSTSANPTESYGISNFILYASSYNYPDDYEGPIFNDTYNPPLEPYDYVPNFQAVSGLDWKTDIRDTTFSTFDGILWTCSEDGNSIIENDTGLAPVLYYQVWDDTTSTILQSGYNSSTAPINFQAPKINENKTYRIAGWYDCGGTVEFSDAANYEFTITANGLLGSQDLMQDCIIESFPFIDLPGCVSNLSVIVNALSFGIININNQWQSTESCHNLSVLGNWISRPGEQICPLFPSYVRTVVTPFVTFILGLITMRYLTGRMGDNY